MKRRRVAHQITHRKYRAERKILRIITESSFRPVCKEWRKSGCGGIKIQLTVLPRKIHNAVSKSGLVPI